MFTSLKIGGQDFFFFTLNVKPMQTSVKHAYRHLLVYILHNIPKISCGAYRRFKGRFAHIHHKEFLRGCKKQNVIYFN